MDKIKQIKINSFKSIQAELTAARMDKNIRAVIFCLDDEQKFAEKKLIDSALIEYVRTYPVPLIFLVKDSAYGVLFELVLASHICIAAEKAEFQINDKKHLAKYIGSKNVEKLKSINKKIDAETALDLGIINSVVRKENLEAKALAMAETISNLAPIAIKSCLEAVTEGLEMNLEDGLKLEAKLFAEIFATEDMKEGTRAFLEKRKPVFKGT